jgi:hypothetical protein
VSIDLADYREFFPNAKDPNDPYYFCFYAVVEKFSEANSFCIPLDRVDFTFDQNIEARYNAAALFDQMLALPEWKGHDLVANELRDTTKKNPRIQVADLVAREGMKKLDHRIGPVHRMRRSLIALERTKRFSFAELGREYFRSVVQITPEMKKLPSADISKYRQWLTHNRLNDNTTNQIRYHAYMLSKLQRPAQKG